MSENMPLIYERIGQAMADLGPISKDKTNKQQGYKFRGIDDVYNALQPVLCKHGLFVVPRVLERTREERQTANGGRLIYTILKVHYTMFAPDGSNIEAVVDGEGMDSADKSTNKAMSAAYKYFMFQLFSIPTEELIDADAETPSPSKPVQKPAQKTTGSQPQPAPANSSQPQQAQAAKVSTEDSKQRVIRTLKQNALFAYGEASVQKLQELMEAQGVSFDTMTNAAYKAIEKQIIADIAASRKAGVA